MGPRPRPAWCPGRQAPAVAGRRGASQPPDLARVSKGTAMQQLQGRSLDEVAGPSSWPELLEVVAGTEFANRGVVMMSDNRPPVVDAALVALLLALAFDALSTALVWGLVQHLPS